ncbi:hypothetical protein KL86DES1_21461 [uncultured Desulfovibrio sp.]|uniref:Uncharacterized protein n=1 Tax=uncultured Desulfovibrio sp. TaxID=167968 RepID=A0A212L835_9BACT|nr:hypothetical protein KL86DES1_21461 [uncultured Desulfovibrio sp.]VZH34359.1 conserved protein of unknown function [Desulfovibrio sp. 86]
MPCVERAVAAVADRRKNRSLAVGQHAAHSFFVGLIHCGGLTKTHFAAGGLLGENVAQVLATTLELAAASLRKTLGGGTPGFNLGHGVLLNESIYPACHRTHQGKGIMPQSASRRKR